MNGKPSAADMALLGVCCARPETVNAAWALLIHHLPEPKHENETPYPPEWRGLLPLTAWVQEQYGLSGPGWWISRLRMARTLEIRRLQAVHDACLDILSQPSIRDHIPLAVGGLILGETLYPEPSCRHTGNLTLLLSRGTCLGRLSRRLQKNGYRLFKSRRRSRLVPMAFKSGLWLYHPTGFHLRLVRSGIRGPGRTINHETAAKAGQWIPLPGGNRIMGTSDADTWTLLCRGVGLEHRAANLHGLVDMVFLYRRLLNNGADQLTGSPAAWDAIIRELAR